jgi:hypothetical protein
MVGQEITIAIADDPPVVRNALRVPLSRDDRVIVEAGDGDVVIADPAPRRGSRSAAGGWERRGIRWSV